MPISDPSAIDRNSVPFAATIPSNMGRPGRSTSAIFSPFVGEITLRTFWSEEHEKSFVKKLSQTLEV